MNTPKVDGNLIKKNIILIVNILVVSAIVFILLTYFKDESTRKTEKNREEFEAVATTMARTIIEGLESHQELVDSAAKYINTHDLTIEEAIDYVNDFNTENTEHMFHIVWVDDFTGLSTRGNKLDPDDISVDYSGIYSAKYTKKQLISVMDMVYGEDGDMPIHATRSFTNPTDAKQSVAFYNEVSLVRDGEKAKAIIMLLVETDTLKSDYRFPEGIFENTGTALIDKESGNYVIPSAELKNTSFYEYLLQYNGLSYDDIEALKNRVINEDVVGISYLDYKSEMTRYIISDVKECDGWALVAFIPEEDLREISQENLWQVTFMLVALILLLLIFDIVYFFGVNKKLEASLESEHKANLEAKAANRSKTDFLSTMSHDIRTPLNAILGLTALTKEHIGDERTVKSNLHKIEQAGQHLLTLINDILDISKIESGKLSFNVKPFSLNDTREYLEDLCRGSADDKQITLDIAVDTVSDRCLLGDRLRLYQIFINILTNAIKYTKEGGKVSVSLREDINENMAQLTYMVSDNGIGMSEEFMEHMYENFSRAQDGRIDKVQGTGLGLAICKKIIDELGGSIECQSRLNEGTTFTVKLKLPLADTEEENKPENSAESIEGLNILVAEDNDLNWEIISDMLDLKGMKCERAQNGLEAVEMLKAACEQESYDLVLMDIQMPVMNGLEATGNIRAAAEKYMRNIPIIALTADAFTENIEECLRCGMDSHVAKPVNIDILMREIGKVRANEKK